MIQETIARLEAQLKKPEGLRGEERAELLRLLTALKEEVDQLPDRHSERAQTIAGFAALSAHQAASEHRDPRLLGISLEGLRTSAEGFEQSHPRLVHVVNSICTTLSGLGI